MLIPVFIASIILSGERAPKLKTNKRKCDWSRKQKALDNPRANKKTPLALPVVFSNTMAVS